MRPDKTVTSVKTVAMVAAAPVRRGRNRRRHGTGPGSGGPHQPLTTRGLRGGPSAAHIPDDRERVGLQLPDYQITVSPYARVSVLKVFRGLLRSAPSWDPGRCAAAAPHRP